MTSRATPAEERNARGLGWDIDSSFSSNRGELLPIGSFGHTGFTGTSLWLDPGSGMFVVFLSNRLHPDGKGDVTAVTRARGNRRCGCPHARSSGRAGNIHGRGFRTLWIAAGLRAGRPADARGDRRASR